MRRFFFLLSILYALTGLSSCDTTEVSTTTLSVKVAVEVTDTISVATNSETASYIFSQSLTESLEENQNVNLDPNSLKSMNVEDFFVKFIGIQNNQSIDTVKVSVEGVGPITTLENIASSILAKQPELNSSILVQIGNILRSEQQLTVSVSGTTRNAPMSFVVETYFVISSETSPF